MNAPKGRLIFKHSITCRRNTKSTSFHLGRNNLTFLGKKRTRPEYRLCFMILTSVRCFSQRISRACKLAMREEQEMDACTFQPNVRRKSTTSYRSDRPRAATVGSSHSKMISGSEHSRHSGQGEEGQGSSQHSAGRATRDHRRSSTSVEVGQRLFLESRRLKERRFEGEERKRMAEEEAYARSCTFKVL